MSAIEVPDRQCDNSCMEESNPAAETPPNKLVSPEEFITRWPLYTPASVDGFTPPERISYHCHGHQCRKETTWVRMGGRQQIDLEGHDNWLFWVWYSCGLCNREYLFVMFREIEREMRVLPTRRPIPPSISSPPPPPLKTPVTTKIQKVGQFPPLSIDIPKALEKTLGKGHTAFYRNALINRNEGFGLGAVSYIRRVVEDKTEELIEIVAQLAEAQQVDAQVVEKIRAAKTEKTTYDNKLKIASTIIPKSLMIEGINPLGVLFGLVSAGLHDLTEEQCVQIADDTKSVFEYTFTRLRAETEERKDFADKVKKWAGGNHPALKPTS